MADESDTEIGKRIRQYRKKLGLSQKALGKKAGLPMNTVARTERGSHTATRITLNKLANALGVSVGDLLS